MGLELIKIHWAALELMAILLPLFPESWDYICSYCIRLHCEYVHGIVLVNSLASVFTWTMFDVFLPSYENCCTYTSG